MPLEVTTLDFFVAVVMGIPLGILLPVRPRYLYIDIVLAFTFFVGLSCVRLAEGTFSGDIPIVGVLFFLFFIGVVIGTRFNRRAKEKEAVIKFVQQTGTPVEVIPPKPPE